MSNPLRRDPLFIETAELRLIELPLLNPFTISSATMVKRVAPIVVLRGGGCEGYAEGVADMLPDYLPETIVSSMMIMRDV
ncbi:MAG: o-succinylbenzoate synthase, partial [Mesorhizobium sp.]